MQVKDIMSEEACYIEPTTTVKEAAQKMREKDCGFLAIGKETEGKLSGVITDRDIATRSVAEGHDPAETTVEKVQTSEVLYCFEEDGVEDAAQSMHDNQVYRLIVLNNEGDKRLRGVVTLGDIVRSDETRAAENAAKGISAQQQAA